MQQLQPRMAAAAQKLGVLLAEALQAVLLRDAASARQHCLHAYAAIGAYSGAEQASSQPRASADQSLGSSVWDLGTLDPSLQPCLDHLPCVPGARHALAVTWSLWKPACSLRARRSAALTGQAYACQHISWLVRAP